MREDHGAGGLASAGGSGISITVDADTAVGRAGAVAARESNSDEDDVPNTIDYNGEVSRYMYLGCSGVSHCVPVPATTERKTRSCSVLSTVVSMCLEHERSILPVNAFYTTTVVYV